MGHIDYYRTETIIEITIRDSTGRKIDTFKMNAHERKKYRQTLIYLQEKYGFIPEVPLPCSLELKKEIEEQEERKK